MHQYQLVDTNAGEQIRSILELLTNAGRSAFDGHISQLHSSRAANGLLRSGGTVTEALSAMEESGEAVLTSSVDQVSCVAQDGEAFAMLQTHIEGHVRYLELKLDDVLRISGAAKDGIVMSAASREAKLKFETLRSKLLRKMEAYRFTFTQASPVSDTEQGILPSLPQATKIVRNQGGKPLGKHWDSMWAAMAIQIYVGDLKPTTQAEIERAMKDWFAQHDLEIGDTAIRERAKVLWTQYQAAR